MNSLSVSLILCKSQCAPRDQEEEEAEEVMAIIHMMRPMNGSTALKRDTTVQTMEPVLYCLAVSMSPAEALDEACSPVGCDRK